MAPGGHQQFAPRLEQAVALLQQANFVGHVFATLHRPDKVKTLVWERGMEGIGHFKPGARGPYPQIGLP